MNTTLQHNSALHSFSNHALRSLQNRWINIDRHLNSFHLLSDFCTGFYVVTSEEDEYLFFRFTTKCFICFCWESIKYLKDNEAWKVEQPGRNAIWSAIGCHLQFIFIVMTVDVSLCGSAKSFHCEYKGKVTLFVQHTLNKAIQGAHIIRG